MIAAHQPTIFGSQVIAAISSKKNGNMKLNHPDGDAAVVKNRQKFLKETALILLSRH
jgi:hypothetical protein